MPHAEQLPILMMRNEAILVRDGEQNSCPGMLHVIVYSRRDRLLRAAKVLALYWVLAAVTVFIPIAHFVLVPGFFLAGPLLAYLRYKVTARNERAAGRCPVCGNDITLPLEPAEQLPLWKYCPRC